MGQRSHPLRVRGLKQYIRHVRITRDDVAPFTGAWIETTSRVELAGILQIVAPFTGAWIETEHSIACCDRMSGRTLYGCVD